MIVMYTNMINYAYGPPSDIDHENHFGNYTRAPQLRKVMTRERTLNQSFPNY